MRENMTLVQEILYTFSNYPGGYRLLYDIIYEKRGANRPNKTTIQSTLSRLKKQGLLSNQKGTWSITPEGKELLQHKKSQIKRYFSTKTRIRTNLSKTIIIVFDIPEKERNYRDWLRSELISFGFEMIQRSVWFGPALPKEFITYLDEHKLLRYIHFFKVEEKDLI